MPGQKTYWHLLDNKRLPTEYELVSARLHYYTARGFEVEAPLQQWYRQYQQGSPLLCSDWEQFVDPRQTTYTTYTGLQATKEAFVDGLLEWLETTAYDRSLSPHWLQRLEQVLPPLRYPCHALQMVAAYIGQMGPCGRLTLVGMFQAADEVRRIQRLAYRMRQLQLSQAGFGANSQTLWQHEPHWQPLREVVEKLLVAYDWGEAFAALNLVVKPLLDRLFMVHFGHLARQAGDHVLQQIFASLYDDCQWQQQWSQALVQLVVQDTPANRQILQQWVNKWYAMMAPAIGAFAPLFDRRPEHPGALTFAAVAAQLHAALEEYLGLAGLELPAPYPALAPNDGEG
jgi:toluene monooxygenase system protein E